MSLRAISAVVVTAAALALAGCGSAPEVPRPQAAEPTPTTEQPAAIPVPFAVEIPAIEARSTLIPLGVTDHDCPDEPPCLAPPPTDEPMQAGWFELGPEPGEVGPAVIAGHVDGIGPDGRKGHPGIFAKLQALSPGDEVTVEDADGTLHRFSVYAVEKVPKDQFPTDRVYGRTPEPELRLITCGGEFEGGHYVDNWVAWARLA